MSFRYVSSLFLNLFLLYFCMPGNTHNEDESPEHSHTTCSAYAYLDHNFAKLR